jgi:hypothetical protein
LLLPSDGQSVSVAAPFPHFVQGASRHVSSVSSGIGAFASNAGLANEKNVRDGTSYEKQSGECSHRPIAATLTALMLFSFCCVFALLSFYFTKTSIDDEGIIKIWRIGLALLMVFVAHVARYLSLPLWGL